MSTICDQCSGTGRFRGRFGGTDWPDCPACAGTGINKANAEADSLLSDRLLDISEKYELQAAALHIALIALHDAKKSLDNAYITYTNCCPDDRYSKDIKDNFNAAIAEITVSIDDINQRLLDINKK